MDVAFVLPRTTRRHDGRVGDPQAVEPVDPELWVDDRADGARRGWVVHRLAGALGEVEQVSVARPIRGHEVACGDSLQRGLARDIEGDAQALNDGFAVLGVDR